MISYVPLHINFSVEVPIWAWLRYFYEYWHFGSILLLGDVRTFVFPSQLQGKWYIASLFSTESDHLKEAVDAYRPMSHPAFQPEPAEPPRQTI